MPAANETVLYDFEGNLESNITAFLRANGFSPRKSLDKGKLNQAYVAVRVEIAGIASQQMAAKPDGELEFNHYGGSVVVTLQTMREGGPDATQAGVSTYHGQRRARLRSLLSRSTTMVNDYTEHYDILRLDPGETEVSTEDDHYDKSELEFSLSFGIRQDAWPTS